MLIVECALTYKDQSSMTKTIKLFCDGVRGGVLVFSPSGVYTRRRVIACCTCRRTHSRRGAIELLIRYTSDHWPEHRAGLVKGYWWLNAGRVYGSFRFSTGIVVHHCGIGYSFGFHSMQKLDKRREIGKTYWIPIKRMFWFGKILVESVEIKIA